MAKSLIIAPVVKSLTVAASPERAFEVFTTGIDRWWPKSHGVGSAPVRRSIIEPFVGGRWYAECEDDSQALVGVVRVWEPGRRFVVSWQITAQWKAEARADYASEVEVRFAAQPNGGTRVDLEHRDFERMGETGGTKMRNDVDNGWPLILQLYTDYLAKAPSTHVA